MTDTKQIPQRIWINADGSKRQFWFPSDIREGYDTPYVPAAAYDELARVAEIAEKWINHYFGEHAARKMPKADIVIAALRKALGKGSE